MKIPQQVIKFLVMAYEWGYEDREAGREKKSALQIAASVQAGVDMAKNKRLK